MAGRIRSHFKDLCLGLALTLALALTLEALIRARGHAPPAPDLSRGFDADASYLIPDPQHAGGFRTQFFDGKLPERQIPPRDERTRVLLMGGSNTAGLSAVTLQRLLNANGSQYEVINLGRAGYGSARVAILVDQALELLDPDLLIIYSGHNEFVERSFRMDLGGVWRDALVELAHRSALIRYVAESLEPERAPGSGRRPEAWEMEYKKFKGLQYDGTLKVIAQYRENLRSICQAADDHGVRVLLCTVIHNLYSAPFESTLPADLRPSEVQSFEEHHVAARSRLPGFLAALLPRDEMQRVHGPDWSTGSPRSDAPDAQHGRRPGLGELAGRPSGHPPVEGWNEKVWAVWDALDQFHKGPTGEDQTASLEIAERELRAALEVCPDHPLALFELGLVQQLLGRDPVLFAGSLKLAARYDRAPRRGNDATNDVVRALASEFQHTRLLDADGVFARRVPHGLMGWEWMADHCHIVGGAKAVLLGDMARAVEGWFGR